MMLHIKFDQDKLTGFRGNQVQKCEIFITQGQVTKMIGLIQPKIEQLSFYACPGYQQL